MIRLLFPFLFLFLNTILVFAQKVEKVEKSLQSLPDVSSKVNHLNNWVKKNYKTDPQNAIYYSNQAIQLADSINYYSGIGDALCRLGVIYKRNEKYGKSLDYYNKAIGNYNLVNDSLGIFKVYLNRGNVFREQNKFTLALNDFYKCLTYFERTGNSKMLYITYNNLGIVHKKLKNYELALSYYQKSLRISQDIKSTQYTYQSYTNIANILSIQNKFKDALHYYKKNLDILTDSPNKYKLAQTYHNIGACFLEMKQYQMALNYQLQSLALKEEIGSKKLLLTSLIGIAESYYMLRNYEKSLSFSSRANKIAQETGCTEQQLKCSKEILKIYIYLHVSDSANKYFTVYENLRDSLMDVETVRQITEITTKYETEKKEKQIVLLEKENESKIHQRNSLIVILALLLAYAIFIVNSYYRNRKTNRLLQLQKSRIEWHKSMLKLKNEALHETNQTKNKLFQIISHDLRSPLASVSGISKLMRIFIQQKKYDLLNESSEDMEQCINSVLSLTDNLLAWSLNQSGKLPYNPIETSLKQIFIRNIETYKTTARQKQIHLNLLLEEDITVHADRQMLDTVIRNLINNSLKFTPPGGIIVIGCKLKNSRVEIFIKDSGIGISKDRLLKIFEIDNSKSQPGTKGEKGNGLGLILCKQFVEQNRGEIWVESEPEVGTTFRFTIPLTKSKKDISVTKSSNSAPC